MNKSNFYKFDYINSLGIKVFSKVLAANFCKIEVILMYIIENDG